ncbi:DUF4367 domain-containing protein [uncultured Oscillibacter sp.]|uniref:DUF4367 domain-containing protein n=1 Tax=uncultured Oscillibacter sp. TaxID=876091 RepID=UPI00345D031B
MGCPISAVMSLYLSSGYSSTTSYMQQGSALNIVTEGVEVRDITVNGLEGQIFLSLDPKNDNTLTWIDPSANLQFIVDAFLNESDILHIAESVALVESTK